MPRSLAALLSSVAISLCAACGGTIEQDEPDGGVVPGPGPATLTALIVAPIEHLIELDVGSTTNQDYTMSAFYSNGDVVDVTAEASWSLDNPAIGSFSGAALDVSGFASTSAEVARITATFAGQSAEAQLTVVAYRQSGAQTDFFFVLPYDDASGEQSKPLDFSTAVPALDVFFAMDATGSMGGEIANLQSDLNSTVIPTIQSDIVDSHFGAGVYMDFPISPFGSVAVPGLPADGCSHEITEDDQPFKLLQEITMDAMSVQLAVNAMSQPSGSPIGCGNDWAEAGIEALYQVATGEGLDTPLPTHVPANNSGLGGVGYREGTMPVVVPISDAVSYSGTDEVGCPGSLTSYSGDVGSVAHSIADAKEALDSICGRVVGVSSMSAGRSDCLEALEQQEELATHTGARVPPSAWDVGTRPTACASDQCCTGQDGSGRAPDVDGLCPLVFVVDSAGNGLGDHIVTGIKMLTHFALFDVNTEKEGESESIAGSPLPAGVTTADFIKSINPAGFTVPPAPPTVPNPIAEGTQFLGVTPGTVVQFDIAALNDIVPPTGEAQLFRATIRVLAGGCTDLDQREAFVLVPPAPISIN